VVGGFFKIVGGFFKNVGGFFAWHVQFSFGRILSECADLIIHLYYSWVSLITVGLTWFDIFLNNFLLLWDARWIG